MAEQLIHRNLRHATVLCIPTRSKINESIGFESNFKKKKLLAFFGGPGFLSHIVLDYRICKFYE